MSGARSRQTAASQVADDAGHAEPGPARRRFQIDEDDEGDGEPQLLLNQMVDVIFILLACFICVTELKKGTLELDVPDVPQASEPADEGDGEPILVEIPLEGDVRINDVPAPDDETLERLIAAAVEQSGPEAPVRIRGDGKADFDVVMGVVSRFSRAGLSRIAFAVETDG